MNTDTGAEHPHTRRTGQVAVAALLSVLGCAKPATPVAEAPSFMFVQVAEDVQADTVAKTLRLHNVTPQVIFFSDRPNRIAGHITMAQYLREWTPAAGKDNLGADPPNATLSVYEPGQPDNAITIVEIGNPRLDGPDMVYDFKLVDGHMPTNGGTTALFIDKVGVGGGVGPGTRGVGVGGPGPGVR